MSIGNFWQTVEVGLQRPEFTFRATGERKPRHPDRAAGGRGPPEYARKVISVPINNNKAAEKAATADRAKFDHSDNLNDSTDVQDKE